MGKFNVFSKYEETIMEKSLKQKLLCYLAVSAVSFSYLILPQNAGVSVPVFVIIQFAFLYFLSPKKKALLIFVPIFILALNSFISANEMWRVPNFFVALSLYSVMTLWMIDDLPIKEVSLRFIANILENIFRPFKYFATPLKWGAETSEKRAATAKRVFVGVAITIPCMILLLALLSSADAIFSNNVSKVLADISKIVSFNALFKVMCGIVAGFYLFGLAYSAYRPKSERTVESKTKTGSRTASGFALLLRPYLSASSAAVISECSRNNRDTHQMPARATRV